MFPALYAILDTQLARKPLENLAQDLADAGVRLVELRDKQSSPRRIHEQSRQLADQLRPLGARLIVNDRADIAVMTEAGGVHVGQNDLPVEDARRICGRGLWVGVSTHNLEQVREADRTSADYIAVGPIFPTATKENPDPVVGIEFLRTARRLTQKSLVAIGGITLESAGEVLRAGVDSLAVAKDLLASSDPAKRAREYLSIAERVHRARK